jgi:hypothetical protein
MLMSHGEVKVLSQNECKGFERKVLKERAEKEGSEHPHDKFSILIIKY